MTQVTPHFRTRLATTAQDAAAAQRLRYRVFVQELGARGALIDHTAGTEVDPFDRFADHLLLEDISAPGSPVVGVYRLMSAAQAQAAGSFSAAAEFDLAPLLSCGRPLLELGRSCLLPAYRGGPAMMHLFAALAQIAAARGDAVMFGVASFHGTDTAPLAEALGYLREYHLAPPRLRWGSGVHMRPMR